MKATSIYGLIWLASIVIAITALTASAAGAAPFSVQLNGADGTEQALPDVQTAQIDDIVWDVVEYDRIPEGSPPGLQEARRQGFKVYGPGKPHYGNAVFGVIPGEDSKQLNRWFEETRAGKVARTSATITFLADNDTTSRSITFNDCVPTQFVEAAGDATGTANGLDTLTVSIGSMTFSEDSQPGPLPQKAWVGATIVSGDPASKATEVFNSWSGGEPALVLDGLLAGARLHTSTPGHKTVSPLVLTRSREKLGPLTGTKGDFIYRWINDALNGNPWRRSVTITENGGHGAAGRSYVYNDGFPVRYSIQGFDSKSSALLTETISCKYETVKYAYPQLDVSSISSAAKSLRWLKRLSKVSGTGALLREDVDAFDVMRGAKAGDMQWERSINCLEYAFEKLAWEGTKDPNVGSHLDHGIVSGLIILQMYNYFCDVGKVLYEDTEVVLKDLTRDALASSAVTWCGEFRQDEYNGSVRRICGAAFHNLNPDWFASGHAKSWEEEPDFPRASAENLFPIPANCGNLYLPILLDTLQDWDRQSFPLNLTNPGVDGVEISCGVSAAGPVTLDFTKNKRTKAAGKKIEEELNARLKDWSSIVEVLWR